MALSESEVRCRDAFDVFLRDVYPARTLCWEDGANPPDLDLYLDEQRFAVEVTAVMKRETIAKVQLPLRVVGAALQDVVEEAERITRDANLLRGAFVVHCPRPILQLGKRRSEIVTRIWDAVGRLWGSPSGTDTVLLVEGGRLFHVTRVSEDGAALHLGGPTASMWRGEAVEELQALVQHRLAAKVECLSHIADPKLLVLEERYPFADAEMYAEISCQNEVIDLYTAIFVVRTGVPSILLHSRLPSLRGVWNLAPAP